jgi:hypothetical protein
MPRRKTPMSDFEFVMCVILYIIGVLLVMYGESQK